MTEDTWPGIQVRSTENVYHSNRRCLTCKVVKKIRAFSWSPSEPMYGGFSRVCSDCADAAYRSKQRAGVLRRKYGITLAEYDELLRRQKNACAVCKKPCSSGRMLAVDHDHRTGAVRGLLCGKCNRAIGLLGDDIGNAVDVAAYLHAAQNKRRTK